MENKLFLLEAPAGGGTKIVLNKQSDLILHEAEIIKPSGIEEGDIIGLPEHFQEVERLIKQETSERELADAYINAAIAAEEAARVDDIKKLDKSLNSEVARATAKDAEHDAAIAAESEARTAADAAHDVEIAAIKETEATNVATLQGNIDSEQARAEAAEKVNADAIAKEVSDRISAVSTEEAARIAADAALQASLDAMDAAYKSADAGLQSAIDSAQAEINGILSGSTLDANSFAEIVTLINSVDTENDTAFASYVLSNDAALAQEVADRIAGDDKLTGDLAAEVVRATAAEAANATAIAAEEAARVAGDAALQASLDAEISGRTAADVAFQASLDAEIANRVAGDDTLTTNLNAEVARAEAAEQVNAQAIADEVVARTTKDAEQDAALTTEVDRAKAAEKVNADAIAAEEARAIAAEGVLDTAIKAEEARAIAKDAEHDAALAAEESARISGDTAIQAELSEAVAELEGVNKAQDEKAAKFEAETNAAIAAEEARAIAAEGVLDTAIKAEEARAKSKDAEHDAAIAKEEADRVAAIAAEEAARISGDTALQASLDAEVVRATAAEAANAEAIEDLGKYVDDKNKKQNEAIAVEKSRIDVILSGSSVDLDQFSEIVNFVENIDLENDASLIAAIDEVRKEHKSDMDAEVKAREKADAEIIAAAGYNDRGDASTSHFEGYLDASAEFGQAEQQLAKLSDSLDELTVKISELKGDKAEAEAAGNTDLVNSLTESIAANEAAKAEQEAEKKDLESSGVLHFEAFMPINEVNFEAWKKDVEATELSDVRTELFDSIKKEADSSVGRDSEIITTVGYNDRGAASNSHFEGYLDASTEFEQAERQLAKLSDSLNELTVKISELEGDKAEAEADGNTDAVADIEVELKMRISERDETKNTINEIQSSDVLEFEAFMPINEVNFEAWKKDVEAIELSDATSMLDDKIKKQADASVGRDSEIIAAVGYNDRGDASNSHFEGYLDASAEFEQAERQLAKLSDSLNELTVKISELEGDKAEAEADGNTDAVADIEVELKMRISERDETKNTINEIQSSDVLEFEAFMPVNEVNFEAWKKDTKDAETSENFAKLNKGLEDEIARATAAEGELTVKVADIIENTDVSKIDSFVEVINEFNKVSEANFDSIYAKKVAITFDGDDEATLANPVKPESLQVYINGLMVELGDDYTEQVVDGAVSVVQFTGDALDLVQAGAKLGAYGVHGSFSSVEFNGIDYDALIAAKEAKINALQEELATATSKEKQSGIEFEDLKSKLKSEIEAANAAGDADYAAKVQAELANVEAARTEEVSSFTELENSINSQIQSLNAEIATLQAEANEA